MLAMEYIEFLDLLWKRVRPDLLFPPPPPPEGEKPLPIFSTTLAKTGEPFSATTGRKKKGRKGRRARHRKTSPPSSSYPTPSGRLLEGGVEGASSALSPRFHGRPPPPPPAPPPRTPDGLLLLHIPGFRPREAQRAAWVGKGGIIDPEVEQGLRAAVHGAGGGDDGLETRLEHSQGREEEEEKEAEEPGWKRRRRQRLLAAGIAVESDEYLGRAAGRHGGVKTWEGEEMDTVGDFAARVFPLDIRDVREREPRGRL